MEVEGQQPVQQQAAAPIMEDEYIEMDTVISDPTDKTEPTTPSHGKPLQLRYAMPDNFHDPLTQF